MVKRIFTLSICMIFYFSCLGYSQESLLKSELLNKNNQQLLGEIKNAKYKLKEQMELFKNLEVKYQKLQDVVKNLNKELSQREDNNKKIRKIEKDMDLLAREKNQLEQEILKEREFKANARKTILLKEKEFLKELKNLKDMIDIRDKNAESEISKRNIVIRELQKEITNLQEKLLISENAFKSNKLELAKKDEQLNKLTADKEKLKALTSEISDALKKSAEVESQIRKIIQDKDLYIDKITKNLENKEKELTQLNNDSSKNIAELQKQIINITKEKKINLAAKEKYKVKLHELQEKQSQKDLQINTLSMGIDKLNSSLNDLKNSAKELNRTIEVKDQKNKELESKIVNLKSINEKYRKDSLKKVALREKQIDLFKGVIVQKEKDYSELKKRTAQYYQDFANKLQKKDEDLLTFRSQSIIAANELKESEHRFQIQQTLFLEDIDKLTKELEEKNKLLKDTDIVNVKFKSKMEEVIKENIELKKQITTINKNREILNKKLLEKEIRKQDNIINKLQRDLDELNKLNLKKSSDIEEAKKQIHGFKIKIAELATNKPKEENFIKKLKEKELKIKDISRALKTNLSNAHKDKIKWQNLLEQKQRQVDDISVKLKGNDGKIDSLTAELNKIKHLEGRYKTDMTAKNQKIESLEQSLVELKQSTGEFKAELNEKLGLKTKQVKLYRDVVDEKVKKIEELENIGYKLKRESADKEKDIANHKAEAAKLMEAKSKLEKEKETNINYKKEINKLIEEKARLEKEKEQKVLEAIKDNEKLKKDKEGIFAELAVFKQAVESQRDARAKLEKELEKLNKESAEIIANRNKMIIDFEKEKLDYTEKLTKEISAVSAQYKSLKDYTDNLDNKEKLYLDKLKEAEDEINKLNSVLDAERRDKYQVRDRVIKQIDVDKKYLLKDAAAMAELNFKQGNYDRAIEIYNAIIAENNMDELSYVNRGLSYSKLNDFDMAIENYIRAISINPKNILAHYNLGIAYYYKGQFSLAINEYHKVINIAPAHIFAHYNMALAYQRVDQLLAIRQWQRYIRLAGTMEEPQVWIIKAKEHLNRLLANS